MTNVSKEANSLDPDQTTSDFKSRRYDQEASKIFQHSSKHTTFVVIGILRKNSMNRNCDEKLVLFIMVLFLLTGRLW